MGLDLDRLRAMRETLVGYRDLIERERAEAMEARFVEFTGRMGIDPDLGGLREQFVQNLIAGALRELANDVERPTRGQPGSENSPMDFWTEAIRIGLDNLL